MELLAVLLFIWVIIIQTQLNKLSDRVDKLPFREIEKEIVQNIEAQNIQPEETPLPLEPHIVETRQPEEPKENKPESSFENIFLGNLFNKIGAIAIVIGFIIFIKLISSYIVFTPVMKISTGYIASILMVVLGCRIKNEKVKGFKETLWGTSVSVAFITTYCAFALFHIFTPQIAIIVATIILISVYFVADKQKTLSMIIIALIAGYLNPLFIHTNIPTDFVMGYYIFINLLSVIYVYRNSNKDIINFINLILTSLILSGFMIIRSENANITYPLVLWFIYLTYDILRKEKSTSNRDKNNILNWLNFGILALFTICIFIEKERVYAGYLLLSAGLIYAGLVLRYVKNDSVNHKPYLYSALVTLLLSTLLLTDGIYRIGLWSLESVVLAAIGYRYKLSYLGNWALGFLLAAITGTLCTDNVIYFSDIQKYKPILNIRTLSFVFPVSSAYISYKLLSKCENESSKNLSKIFQFSWISLIYLYITFELNSLVYKYNNQMFNKDFVFGMLLSVIGFKYSLQMKRLYNLSKSQLFNVSAYIIGGISLLCILTAGFEYEPIKHFYPVINVRFVAYLMAVITSIYFAKWTNIGFFKYLAAVLGFILVHIETNDFINSVSVNNIDYLLTVMWLVYIGLIILFGIFKNQKFLKNTGIWLSILAILRIFVYDLKDTDMIYKLIAFLTLGVILMIVSYFYNKYNKEG